MQAVSSIARAASASASRSAIDAFIARGTTVPFTTPALHQARLRVDAAGGLEALLPAFSGADGTYVVPFRTLPSVATLTVHDRALFSAIVDRNARSPDTLHAAAFEVARTGLAGARAADTAAKALAREQDETAMAKAWLIAGTIAQARSEKSTRERSAMPVAPAELMRPDGRDNARALLRPLAPMLRASVDEVLQRLDDWGALIAAIGVRGMERPARLRRTAGAVGELASQVRRWSDDDLSGDGDVGRELVVLAAGVAKTCGALFARLDDEADRAATAVADWEHRRDEIGMLTDSVSWVLDGWDYHVLSWRDAAERSRSAQGAAIREIRSAFPRKLAHVFQPAADKAPEMASRKAVRLNQSWRGTGSESELRRRLERLKERTL
ncbi:MAG: hypothetical protein L6R19_12230 [Alphaproteobacteria bacterium]|nr:hypothetical protein [Alphaproteobacteria bacterium]